MPSTISNETLEQTLTNKTNGTALDAATVAKVLNATANATANATVNALAGNLDGATAAKANTTQAKFEVHRDVTQPVIAKHVWLPTAAGAGLAVAGLVGSGVALVFRRSLRLGGATPMLLVADEDLSPETLLVE